MSLLSKLINSGDFKETSPQQLLKSDIKPVKKKKKSSIIEEVKSSDQQQTSPIKQVESKQQDTIQQVVSKLAPEQEEIINPQSIKEKLLDDKAALYAAKNARRAKKEKINEVVNKQQLITPQQTTEKLQEIVADNEELIEVYNQEFVETPELKLSENVDLIETITEIKETIDSSDVELDLDDFEIVETKGKKTKGGYNKVKVTVKSETFNQIKTLSFSRLLTLLNKKADNVISHRITDIRVINNTNKTQLKNAKFKLSGLALTFKPDQNKLKVSKYKRIIINFLEDSFLVFMQDSRDKFIDEIKLSSFGTSQADIEEFFASIIYDFYYVSYTAAQFKIKSIKSGKLSQNEDFFDIAKIISSDKRYYVNIKSNEELNLDKINVKTRVGDNQWLITIIERNNNTGNIRIQCKSTFNKTWYSDIQNKNGDSHTIASLKNGIIKLLDKIYSKSDWDVLGDADDMKIYAMSDKLTYRELRKAFFWLFENFEKEGNPMGIEIITTLSIFDTEKILGRDSKNREIQAYKAEGILGKTNKLSHFILTWQGVPVISGDKRKGSDYITTEQYYEKYNVSDRREYNERQKIKTDRDHKKDDLRNYNARIFMFNLEYKKIGSDKLEIKQFKSVQEFISLIENPK